ncbi:MAG: recombination-associated protein RdgC [Succinivibrionaceae bacterium]|nr:recombination-associated protein RdgC [Succinivibrionaceae bacterium]
MWLKNARIYTLSLEGPLLGTIADQQALEAAIAATPFHPCQAQEISTIGFAPLFGPDGAYTFTNGADHFCLLQEETKLLPASVLRDELEAEILRQQRDLGRELRKTEREALKTAMQNRLLERAFAVRRTTLVWFNHEAKAAAVGASSAKRAERGVATLRQAFGGTFPAAAMQPRCAVEDRITSWITEGSLPGCFTLGTDATLRSSDEDGGTIRAAKEDLSSEEIAAHLKAGKEFSEIQLTYDDSLSLVLTSDLALKRIKPTDQYLERNLPGKIEDRNADLQSNLIIEGALLSSLYQRLCEIFDVERK